jgi:hypothetical protein
MNISFISGGTIGVARCIGAALGARRCVLTKCILLVEEHEISMTEQVDGVYLTMEQCAFLIPIAQGALFAFKYSYYWLPGITTLVHIQALSKRSNRMIW